MDTELVNNDITSITGGPACDEDRTVVSTVGCSDDTSITERVSMPNCEKQTAAPSEIKVNVSSMDGAAAGGQKRRPGRVVAGAIGGVLLCSAAAYYAANAAGYTPHVGGASPMPEDDAANDAADDAAKDVKGEDVDLSEAHLSDDKTSDAQVDVEVDAQADDAMDVLVDDTNEELGGADVAIDNEPEVVVDDAVDAGVDFAEGVNDDMSFNEAFAAARAEVGAGGAFEWRGQIYGTYYADEWEAMSDSEKDAFGDKFDFGGADSDYEAETTTNDDVVVEEDDIDIIVDDDVDDGYDDEVEFLGFVDDDGEVDLSFVSNDESVVLIDIMPDDDDVDLDDNSFDMGDDMIASTDDFDNDGDIDDGDGFFA